MERDYNIYSPKGFHALLDQNTAANEYFNTLPDEVQSQVMRKAAVISSDDQLHTLAEHIMKRR